MDYPNGFDIGTFRAGKSIALSRIVAIWTAIVFFIIVVVCGLVLFSHHFTTNYPLIISIDSNTNEWKVVSYPDKKRETVTRYQVIQEKLIIDYVKDWFTISLNNENNFDRWESCVIEDCGTPEQFSPLNSNRVICCKSSQTLYQNFVDNVLPVYKTIAKQNSRFWKPGRPQVVAVKVDEWGSLWRGYISVKDSEAGGFGVLFFIQVAKSLTDYPATFGYYIEQFSASRIRNE